ncbi:hypothetical protein LI99_22755 [Mycolicibacterium smegmatis]|uniref:Uncharacterized protein n=2 Tax=Mycolicibacterium smegmatis TaxID=1772 RepID=A0A2U9PUH8_MYCSE|nr:hypothetical protein LJ00_22750 [Mycolicibacterium smegmatis MC2 155]AIU16291.1 hypothetical protein LI99_22755 [Mycolicibacterium smegmatis]AWT55446.1 hypothetical protein D806_044840 [Mycolicibacterium smegmatis MKD8]AIU22914.1 hypothetical protein LI98_22760 [Mycolicibacterium smegmatis]SUA33309.1 Uncharacterised protein [Mycolicibacterium smegmatis]
MTMPPSGPFGQQPPHGGPGGGSPELWPQYRGGPTSPPPAGPPPPWGPQQHWPNGPTPPNRGGGGKAKWILGGVAVVLAIALAVVVTVLVVRPDGGTVAAGNGAENSDAKLASADDKGPVKILTDDPTCDAWNTVLDEYSGVTKSIRWDDRDDSVPEGSWTPEQRAMYEAVGKAMTQAADQAVTLMGQTPHRDMRVLYEQFVATSREFVSRIPTYQPTDDELSAASNAAGAAIANICAAINRRTAQSVAPLVSDVTGAEIGSEDDQELTAVLSTPSPMCSDWKSLVARFHEDTTAWRAIDKNIPATEWTPNQRAINDAAGRIMSATADEMEQLATASDNPRLQNIITLAAQYRRGFVKALPNYEPSDSYLELSATSLSRFVNAACAYRS